MCEVYVYCEIYLNDVFDDFVCEFVLKVVILLGSYVSMYEDY